MNQGVYRAPPAVPGLPLPRTGLLAFTLVVCGCAALAVPLAPLLLVPAGVGPASAANAWRVFRDGGMIMWLLLLLDVVALVGVAALGTAARRGKNVPTAIPFGAAVTPLVVAALGGLLANRAVFAAIAGEAVDPEQRVRILAEGAAESMSLDLFGALVTACAAFVVAAAAASVAGSVDVAAAWREPGKRSALGSVGAGVAGAVWVVATVGLAIARARSAGAYVLFEPLAVLGIVPFAVLAGRAAPVLRRWHDGREASRALGAIVVAGLAAVTAAVALELAVRANVTSTALEAISGESVDRSQQARILAEAIEGRTLGAVAVLAHVVLGTATFAVALAPGIGGGPGGVRHPATGSAIAAVALVAVAAAAIGAVGASRARSAAAIAAAGDSVAPAGVHLPIVRTNFSNKSGGGAYGRGVVVRSDGSGGASAPSGAEACYEGAGSLTVYADAAATVGSVRARVLEASRCPTTDVGFVVRRAHDPALEARLGDLAPYLGSVGYVHGTVTTKLALGAGTVLVVRTIDDDAAEVGGKRVKLPADGGAASGGDLGAIRDVGTVRYVFAQGDTMARVVKTVTAVEAALQASNVAYDVSRELDLASPPPPAVAP